MRRDGGGSLVNQLITVARTNRVRCVSCGNRRTTDLCSTVIVFNLLIVLTKVRVTFLSSEFYFVFVFHNIVSWSNRKRMYLLKAH